MNKALIIVKGLCDFSCGELLVLSATLTLWVTLTLVAAGIHTYILCIFTILSLHILFFAQF